jgi:hypothetical protein
MVAARFWQLVSVRAAPVKLLVKRDWTRNPGLYWQVQPTRAVRNS